MALGYFNPLLRTNDLVQDLKWDDELRARFDSSEEAVLSTYPLTHEERVALRERDFKRLYELGLHPSDLWDRREGGDVRRGDGSDRVVARG
jgi:protocatechuate 4,5-dioxygenase alpha chain